MALRPIVSSLTEVPESLRSEYEAQDGKFVLKLEGVPPGTVSARELEEANRRLAEFRDNNRALNAKVSEIESHLRSFEGIDPTEVATLRERMKQFEQQGIGAPDAVTARLDRAVRDAVTPLQRKLEELDRQNRENAERAEQYTEMLRQKELETGLTQMGLELGVDERALPDFLRRGLEVFTLNEAGEPVALNGDAPVYSSRRPAEPLTVEEWAADLMDEAPHLFKPSKGGGAAPGAAASGRPRVIGTDPLEFGMNLEDIAAGKVIVE